MKQGRKITGGRYIKSRKTRLHERLPDSADVNFGDYVKVMQCRPLSKIIHFIFIEKIHNAGETKE